MDIILQTFTKSKMKKLLSKFLENNYLLKNNLKYPSYNGDISNTKNLAII